MKERRKVVLVCKEPSLTRQSEKDACDINKIVSQFQRTGILPPVTRQGFYEDVSELGGYREVLDRVAEAERYFEALPAVLREEFKNDPAEFLDFVSMASKDDLQAKGLLEGEEPAVPAPAEAPKGA